MTVGEVEWAGADGAVRSVAVMVVVPSEARRQKPHFYETQLIEVVEEKMVQRWKWK